MKNNAIYVNNNYETFTQKGHLKTHERIHTGDKPFSCSQCDCKCITSSALKRHERIHRGDKPLST